MICFRIPEDSFIIYRNNNSNHKYDSDQDNNYYFKVYELANNKMKKKTI